MTAIPRTIPITVLVLIWTSCNPQEGSSQSEHSDDPGSPAWSEQASCSEATCGGEPAPIAEPGENRACFCDPACVDRGDCCSNVLESCGIDRGSADCDALGATIAGSKLFTLYRQARGAFVAACNANPKAKNLFPDVDGIDVPARIAAYCEFDIAVRGCLVCGVRSGQSLAAAFDDFCAPLLSPEDSSVFEREVLGR